jgi:DNA (cytosine-5)-methyltransferase 1
MESKTTTELRNLAKELGLKGVSKMKKTDLILALATKLDHVQPVKKSKIIICEDDNKLKMVDLFAGTGAFSLAFTSTDKVDVVFANDFAKMSKDIYDLNFEHKLTLKDINEINPEEVPPHDILTGGFPCQPFSIAGLRQGFNDDRSNVFWKILKIISFHKPRFVVLENVKNILSHDDHKTFETIQTNIKGIGYHIMYKVLNTSKITGIPQNRERVYIVCFRDEKDFCKFSFDFDTVPKLPIESMLLENVNCKYYYTEKSSTWDLLSKNVLKHGVVYQYRRVYVRENKNMECPTLTANMGSGGHNVPIVKDKLGIRKLTPRECFNFQGFPESYNLGNASDSSLYKLCGNAVSYPVVKLIADKLMKL